jgi:dihydrofolate reductase
VQTKLPVSRTMSRLIYSAIASLDGYVADAAGNFEWAAPDEEVHAFVNDLERSVGTYLYGRRMYETMVFWESPAGLALRSPVAQDFARIWQAADKVVYSTTLQTVASARTRLERRFEATEVRQLKATAERHLTVGGAELAAQAIEAGLVDDYQLFLVPVLVGGGRRVLPHTHNRLELDLLEERRFRNGTVYLRYGTPEPLASAAQSEGQPS